MRYRNIRRGSGTLSSFSFLATIAGIGALYLFLFGMPSLSLHGPIGEKLPNLELGPLTGDLTPVDLKGLKGKVALVNFWGTWCPPCRMEFPHIADLANHFRDRRDVRILAVSSSGGSDSESEVPTLREATAAFLAQSNATIPTYVDIDARTRRALAEAGAGSGFAYPTTIILDKEGVIRGYWQGYRPGCEDEMRRMIDQLTGQSATADKVAAK